MINLIKVYFRVTFLNKVNIFTSIVLPILLITILGTALSGVFTHKAPDKVSVKIEEHTFTDSKLIKRWSQNPSVSTTLMFVDSKEFMNLSEKESKVIAEFKGYNPLEKSIGFVYYKNLISIITLNSISRDTPKELTKYESKVGLSQKIVTPIKSYETLNSVSYYSVTMIILTLAYTMTMAGNYIYQTLKSSTGSRIRLSGISNFMIINAGIITLVAVAMMQALLVILVLKVGFKDTIYTYESIFVLFLASFFFILLGMNFAIHIENQKKFGIILNCIIPVFVMISGGYYKIDFGVLKYISPNYWFTSEIFNIYTNDTFRSMNILAMIGAILFLYFLAGISINKIEGVNYDNID